MKAFALTCALLLIYRSNADFEARSKFRSHQIDPQIIGGTAATPGEIPYIVSLRDVSSSTSQEFHICGGGIVSTTWVLTTALCVYLEEPVSPPNLIIVAGETHLYENGTNIQRISIKQIITHPDFSPSRRTSDIALINLDGELTTNLYVKSLPLAYIGENFEGQSCDISGWGYTTPNGLDSLTLRTTSVVVRYYSECINALGSTAMSDGTLCAGQNLGAVDFCDGDEGGPLSCEGVFAGLASWNDNCATPGSFGVYTSIAFFRSWIDATMGP